MNSRNISLAVLIALAITGLSLPAEASLPVDFTMTFASGGVPNQVAVSAWVPDTGTVRMLVLPSGWGVEGLTQATYRALGFGVIRIYDPLGWPHDYSGATAAETAGNFQLLLNEAGLRLSHSEISNAPMAFYGFSQGGWLSSKLAAHMPERTLGFFADHSGTYATTISDQAKLVPGVFNGGSLDGVTASSTFPDYARWRSAGGQVALGLEWNTGHWSYGNDDFLLAFLDQAIRARYPSGQTPSNTPGNPLGLNSVALDDGWLMVAPNQSLSSWPIITPYDEYPWPVETASWMPTKAMAMVMRVRNAYQPNGTPPVLLLASVGEDGYTTDLGGTIDLQLSNVDLNLADVTRVQVFHEDDLIADLSSFPGVGDLAAGYTPTESGIHTFVTVVTYNLNGETMYASDFTTAPVTPGLTVLPIPEPASVALLLLGGGVALIRRRLPKHLLSVAGVLCVAMAGNSAFASITVSVNAPTVADRIAINGGMYQRHEEAYHTSSSNLRAWGQTFRVNPGEYPFMMDKITMVMRPGSNFAALEGAPMVVRFNTFADPNAVTPNGTLYDWTNVGNLPSGMGGTWNDGQTPLYVTFDVPNWYIAAGQQYGFYVDFASPNAAYTGLEWGQTGQHRVDSRDTYWTGQGYGSGGDDMTFFIHKAVPEPATITVLACSAGLLLRQRRKDVP